MARVLVRRVPSEVIEKIRERAHGNHRSLEAELRVILQEAAKGPPTTAYKDIERVRALFDGRSFTDSEQLLREDRDR